MSLLTIIGVLVLLGVLLWIIQSAPFISGSMKPIITWVVIAVVALWLVTQLFGLGGVGDIKVGG